MIDLQVVPLQGIYLFPDMRVDARLVSEVMERSMVGLNNYGVGPSTIVLPLG